MSSVNGIGRRVEIEVLRIESELSVSMRSKSALGVNSAMICRQVVLLNRQVDLASVPVAQQGVNFAKSDIE